MIASRIASCLEFNAFRFMCLTAGLTCLGFTGCCCVPAGGTCGASCGPLMQSIGSGSPCGGSCGDVGCGCGTSVDACGGGCDSGCSSCGPQMPGLLARLSSCRGACGEVYIDERINHPPTIDQCGYDCGGCGTCGQCRPLANLVKKLWGRPYNSQCDTSFLNGPSCGCESVSSCDGGCSSGHCGEMSYSTHAAPARIAPQTGPIYMENAPSSAPSVPMQAVPQIVPPAATPNAAPQVAPTSARRLNPARQRSSVRHATYQR
ncbi:MAG: hypothetical protein AB8B50_21525 [Pirellulaceae bacterium]